VETTETAIPEQQPVELETLVESPLPAVPGSTPAPADGDLGLVLEVPVELAVEIGRTRMTVRETLAIAPGSIIALDRMAGEPVDLLVNGRRIARGEVVAIDEEFGLRVTEVVSPQRRLSASTAEPTA
jgi:flagellar motor switch protein FliN/FliY